MSADLYFDTTTRELVINNGDFSIIENASTQKGNIVLFSHGAFVSTPALGIGFEIMINAASDKLAKEMNRWASQCQADGAKKANWNYQVTDVETNEIQVNTDIFYE